jgi:signal transduction histidine kinase
MKKTNCLSKFHFYRSTFFVFSVLLFFVNQETSVWLWHRIPTVSSNVALQTYSVSTRFLLVGRILFIYVVSYWYSQKYSLLLRTNNHPSRRLTTWVSARFKWCVQTVETNMKKIIPMLDFEKVEKLMKRAKIIFKINIRFLLTCNGNDLDPSDQIYQLFPDKQYAPICVHRLSSCYSTDQSLWVVIL